MQNAGNCPEYLNQSQFTFRKILDTVRNSCIPNDSKMKVLQCLLGYLIKYFDFFSRDMALASLIHTFTHSWTLILFREKLRSILLVYNLLSIHMPGPIKMDFTFTQYMVMHNPTHFCLLLCNHFCYQKNHICHQKPHAEESREDRTGLKNRKMGTFGRKIGKK